MTTTPTSILIAVSNHYGIPVAEIRGGQRYKKIAHARHMCAFLMRRHCKNVGMCDIARELNLVSHTTISACIAKIGARIHDGHESVIADVAKIEAELPGIEVNPNRRSQTDLLIICAATSQMLRNMAEQFDMKRTEILGAMR